MSPDLRHVIRESKGKVLLQVRVQPRARQNALVGVRDNALMVQVAAAPVEGAANASVIAILARALHLPKSTFTVHQGTKSRQKTIHVNGIEADELLQLLEKYFL